MDKVQISESSTEKPDEREAAPAPRQPGFWRRPLVIVLGTVVLAAALFLGLRYLAEGFTQESTDDAFLDAHIVSVAPKVAGQVQQVYVSDNQVVKAGESLIEIDPRDLQVQLDQKRSAVAAAEANVGLIKSTLDLLRAEIATAEATAKQTAAEAAASQATAERAQADRNRAEELILNHTISPQEFDSAKATAVAAEANFKAAQEKAASDQSKVTQAQAQFEAGRKGYDRAIAQTRQTEWDTQAAELSRSYARITAPEDGRVTRKAVSAGDYVQAGQRLLALVPHRLFVTANFKETQLVNLRTNQAAQITIDSVSSRPFRGHIDSIQAGSGARFSLLPPENAVGNYVKVVQRVPVKIVFDESLPTGHVLGPGMSVVPSVRVKDLELPEWAVAAVAVVVAAMVGFIWWHLARRGA